MDRALIAGVDSSTQSRKIVICEIETGVGNSNGVSGGLH
jgi:hypothetical protein